MKVKLEFQYFEDCPNHKQMQQNLFKAMKGLEDTIELRKIIVGDEKTANEAKFRGSPTLLINGKDLEDLPEPIKPALACRFYSRGIPSSKTIRNKIIKEINRSK